MEELQFDFITKRCYACWLTIFFKFWNILLHKQNTINLPKIC